MDEDRDRNEDRLRRSEYRRSEETVPGRQVGPEPGAGRQAHAPAPHTVSSAARSAETQPTEAAPRSAGIPFYVWLLGLVVALLVLAVGALWTVYALRGEWAAEGPTPTPIVWTPTPRPQATAAATPMPSPTPQATDEPLPTAMPGIEVGRTIRVFGTGGQGLSLREGPGVEYPRVDVALDGETFLVVDGPTSAGGSEWWKLRDPDNDQRAWWAAANFLEPIE